VVPGRAWEQAFEHFSLHKTQQILVLRFIFASVLVADQPVLYDVNVRGIVIFARHL
jgi:hypothetical protein